MFKVLIVDDEPFIISLIRIWSIGRTLECGLWVPRIMELPHCRK